MRNDRALDELYHRASSHNGWLSYLAQAQAISPAEEAHLAWREDCHGPVRARMRSWMDQIEQEGGIELINAETPPERLQALCRATQRIERVAATLPREFAEAYRDLMGYRKLLNQRAVLKLKVDGPDLLPEWKLKVARAYRLDDLLKDRLKRRFMKCPVHPEKHGSFFVTAYGYCFGCGRSWDTLAWLMEFEGMTFKQAVEYCNR